MTHSVDPSTNDSRGWAPVWTAAYVFREVAPHAATLAWEEILESGLDLLLRGLEQRLAG
jgi:hypothetical protein